MANGLEDRVKELVEENKKDELVEMAEEFDLDSSGNKDDIAERIAKFELGAPEVSEEEAEKARDDAGVGAPAETDYSEEESVLVKMERNNASYTYAGVTFTPKNPYRVVPVSVAEHLEDVVGGFRQANSREAEQYYS